MYDIENGCSRSYGRGVQAMYFIGQAIQAAGAITGAVAQGIGAAQNNKKMDGMISDIQSHGNKNDSSYANLINTNDSKKNDLQSMYKNLMNTSWDNTAEGANAKRQMQQQAAKSAKSAANAAIRSGGTIESALAQAGAMQEANANAIANMAAKSTARQDALRMEAQNAINAMDDKIYDMSVARMNAGDTSFNQSMGMKMNQINASNAAWGALAKGFGG